MHFMLDRKIYSVQNGTMAIRNEWPFIGKQSSGKRFRMKDL